MYIPNEEWDEIISLALIISERPDIAASMQATSFINMIINIEDRPLPKIKKSPMKGYHKIAKSRLVLRKFIKTNILEYAKKQMIVIRSK